MDSFHNRTLNHNQNQKIRSIKIRIVITITSKIMIMNTGHFNDLKYQLICKAL